MTNPAPDWPATRWGLSAPESYVVLNGPHASGSEAYKLGLMELVARGVLTLETIEQRGRFSRKSVARLRDGPRTGTPREPPLAAIWDLYQRAPHKVVENDGQPGVAVEDLARAAAKQYQSLRRYVARDVLPALIDRGLYEARHERVLWIFPTTRYVLTPAGESARTELQRWMDVGTARLAGWSDSDPSHAMAYAGMAGASLLLMPELFPDLRRLRERTRLGDADSEGYVGGPISTSDAGGDRRDTDPSADPSGLDSGGIDPGGLTIGGLELPSFDLSGFDFGSLDFSAFDALGSAMSAIDAAVDSGGGGDGGGDSGGGGGSDGDGGSGES